jgi:hypothetical protein
MVFVAIVITAIFLYIWDYKVTTLFLFFFFVTSGFNLLPETATQFTFFSKGIDYAIILLLGITIIESLFAKNYLKPDNFTKYLVLLGIFLLVCMAYSRFALGLELTGIIRTCRFLFLWVVWFLFRSLKKEQMEVLLKGLFFVTIFCAILYILQLFFETSILNKGEQNKTDFMGMKFMRFYNHPDMLYFFTLMAVFHNPLKGILKIITALILSVALFAAFHRSLIGFFFVSLFVGYILSLSRLNRIKIVSVTAFLGVAVILFAGYKFLHSRTYVDVKTVLSGNILDVASELDIEMMQESTFTFRMAHLLERNMYLQEHPVSMLVGAGLVTEDSKKTVSMFNFDIGLAEELTGETIQLDSGDISYSVLFMRYGYLGTALYLAPFIFMMVFFYRNKENRYALFAFSFLVLVFGVSFFSANLMNPINFLLPMICYHIVNKSESNDIIGQIHENQ